MNILKTLFDKHKTILVTGTDTEVGKTYTSSLIIKHLGEQGENVFPFKPISAGTEFDSEFDSQVNEDAKQLWLASNKRYSIDQINPIVFEPAIAPHIAAEQVNYQLDKALLQQELALAEVHDKKLIEGAGGWLLPLNQTELMSDWVAENDIPVIMVVGVKLGCLNHALLTAQAIENSGCKLIGWVANYIQGRNEIAEQNVAYLEQKLSAPKLFELQKNQTSL